MEMPSTLAEFEARAAEALEAGPHGYYAGGACDELTLRDNVESWRRLALRPHVMVDVSRRDPTTTVLGRERPHPIFVAPTAYQRLAHPDGEPASARAAAATGSLFCLSSLATATVPEVAAAAPEGARWLQLYVFRDRAVSERLAREAGEHGYEALVVTVDLPVLGVRERDVRSRFEIDDALSIPSVGAMNREGPLSMLGIGDLVDPSLTWPDLERFAELSGLPVLVKGVLRPDDARMAVEHGAAGVIVSNHGGRQLDTVLSGADALPAVVDEVGGEVDVLVDGGIRRGSDVVKALALGARAVLVGRPVVWGLAVGGEAGVRAVLETLLAELDVALALVGVPRAADLDRSLIEPGPWASRRVPSTE